ncbi:hypothetical protein [Flavobacterium suncheonense]|uniref:Uncharacterized protein n=1 Tax=Flavobacterium suncheonense GH29-5 = DSM 17707 TaxID=1121899 RepID=A0A0A2MAR7_9FLAO|nr:hypothetical protein [Flavobacterium suncheonense]KGO89747.1 hypothetical protein Q764_06040 [Flavobacterium suncheonense GH29-5 = DSM 17707]
METIFDHKPTHKELNDIRFDSLSFCQKFGIEITGTLTPELYKEHITEEFAYYDIACLFEFRGESDKAKSYWDRLPKEMAAGLGNDYLVEAI